MVEKPLLSATEAIGLVGRGMSLMIGGFLGCGTPPSLIAALLNSGTDELRIIANDTAVYDPDKGRSNGFAELVAAGRCSGVVTSHIGTNKATQQLMREGALEVTLVPQGTLVERIRAAGAGLGGVLTPTGVGTEVEEGKQRITLHGKAYLLETALFADVALIYAARGDRAGNLVYRKTERNFSPVMATAAKTVIAEVEELVEIGEIDPEVVVTPGLYVDYLVLSEVA